LISTLPSGDAPVAKLGGGVAVVFVPDKPATAAAYAPVAVGEADAADALEIIDVAAPGEIVVVDALDDVAPPLETVRIIWPRTSV